MASRGRSQRYSAKILLAALATLGLTGMGMTIFANADLVTPLVPGAPSDIRRLAEPVQDGFAGAHTTVTDLLFLSDFAYADWDHWLGRTIAQLDALPSQDNPFVSDPSMLTIEANMPLSYALSAMGDWKAIDCENHVATSGFYGVAFENEATHEIVIAFRGSSNAGDYVYDLNTIALHIPMDGGNQLAEARAFVRRVIRSHPNAKVLLTGHSLGGWLAERISLDLYEHRFPELPRYRFLGTATFNAPGFQEGTYVSKQEWQNNERGRYDKLILNYVIVGDLIGQFETPIGAPRVYLRCDILRGTDTVNPFMTHPLYNFFFTDYFEAREGTDHLPPVQRAAVSRLRRNTT